MSAEKEPELPLPELDEGGVVEDKSGDIKLPMGDESLEASELDIEKDNDFRDSANAAFSEGNYEKALEDITKAIELNPGSSIFHAKRANILIKMSKLSAAIRDCSAAIQMNPDSAQGYKYRGRAHRLLGDWINAHDDLATACKLDYDDTVYEWLKEVEPNAKKLQEYNRAIERQAEERDLRQRKERVRKAQEANKRASTNVDFDIGAEEGGANQGGFDIGDAMSGLFKDDPELLASIKQDPSIIAKLLECMQNPANIMKHANNPVIQKLLAKLSSKMGGAGGGFPFQSGPEFGGTTFDKPKKAPEPDLD